MIWNGQTPGKRVAGIRVLTTRGEPVTLVHALVRNLMRLVDILPTSYMVGAICILVTRRSQRLGDLAAGTVVVRERHAELPRTLPPLDPALALPPHLAGAFSSEDVRLARDFLLRAPYLRADRRARAQPPDRRDPPRTPPGLRPARPARPHRRPPPPRRRRPPRLSHPAPAAMIPSDDSH